MAFPNEKFKSGFCSEGQVLFYCDEFWNCIKRLQISAYLLCHIASADSKNKNTDRGGDYNNQKGFIDKDNGYGQRRLAYLHRWWREQKNTFIKNHPERKDSNRSISGVGRCRVYALCFSYMFIFIFPVCIHRLFGLVPQDSGGWKRQVVSVKTVNNVLLNPHERLTRVGWRKVYWDCSYSPKWKHPV